MEAVEGNKHRVMQVGDRVRIKASVIVYHHPEHRNQPFDMEGLEGELIARADEWKGTAISANYPYLVKFGKKFNVHLKADEIETL